MKTNVRALALAVLLASAASVSAQAAPAADTTALQFHGFRAGARLDEIESVLRRFDGARLRCDRAKADRRVIECRAVVQLADLGGPVDIWLSAVDSVASILMLSGEGSGGQVDRWRRAVERSYGSVGAKVQGSQWMMQWVRQGRMLRLTWRTDRSNKPVSVSLVDGRVLDAWGRDRATTARRP
ncbi:MAG TPA: hypothetical protein VIG08_16390 [Gemmatimonadales bacterium]|jgi:hypothetical protein